MNKQPPRHITVAIFVIALAGALAATLFAWATKDNLCEPNCNVRVSMQLILAIAGLVPTLIFVYATVAGHRRLARAALITSVLVYAAWALFNDAAVHGWSDLAG